MIVQYRRDPVVLAVTVLPPLLALAGYALYVGDFLDRYYYFSLMPASVLTMVLGLTAFQPPRVARAVAIALIVVGLAVTPARVKFAATLHRMPEYGMLLDGSRWLVEKGHPISGIRTDFQLPPTADPSSSTGFSADASIPRRERWRSSRAKDERRIKRNRCDSGCLPLTDELQEGCGLRTYDDHSCCR